MGAFDEAWELLKMRSSGGVRKPMPMKRPMRRDMAAKPEEPMADTGINIDQESLNMLRNQANQARMAQTRHLEQLKRTDPEAYQKYLTEMAMGVGAGGSDVQGQTIADALGGMGQQ